MLDYKFLFNSETFNIPNNKKNSFFFKNILKLSKYHYRKSKEYKLISDNIFNNFSKIKNVSEIPFVHSSAFKSFKLSTTNNKNNFSVFNSSGTSGKLKSKIFLDQKTSILQSKTLKKIFSNIVKNSDDIFFIENEKILKSQEAYSAKGAAIKGFSQLCNNKFFLIDKNKKIKISFLEKYIKKNPNKKFIIFGFTSNVWEKLIMQLKIKKINLEKNNSILIHGGGWKKMRNLNISNLSFKSEAIKTIGCSDVINYYGMIEQTGSVFLECKEGYFHCSIFSDILIRDVGLKLSKIGDAGLIQTMSLLPLSYPGHNLLTEDMGVIRGIDNCKCGIKGKYFSVIGRVPDSELRGCSDAI